MTQNYTGVGVKQELIENFSQYEEVLNSFICCICLEIVKNPMECDNCESLYCEECWDMMKISGKKCVLHCTAPVKRASKFVRDILSLLKITCEICGKKGIEYDVYVNHMEVCGIFNNRKNDNKKDLINYIKERELKIDEMTAQIENIKLNGIDALGTGSRYDQEFFKSFSNGFNAKSSTLKSNLRGENSGNGNNGNGIVVGGNNIYIGGNIYINGVVNEGGGTNNNANNNNNENLNLNRNSSQQNNNQQISNINTRILSGLNSNNNRAQPNQSNMSNINNNVSNNNRITNIDQISLSTSTSNFHLNLSEEEIRRRLLTYSLPLNQKMELYNAAVEGNLELFKNLITVKKYSIFEEVSQHTFLWTSFHYAMHYGKKEIILFCFEFIDKTLNCLNNAVRLTSKDGRCPLLCLLRSNALDSNEKMELLKQIFTRHKNLIVTNNALIEIKQRKFDSIILEAINSR